MSKVSDSFIVRFSEAVRFVFARDAQLIRHVFLFCPAFACHHRLFAVFGSKQSIGSTKSTPRISKYQKILCQIKYESSGKYQRHEYRQIIIKRRF